MGKTADLTVVQKTTIDTLHKEGKTQKVIAKEAGCSQSSVSKHINREAMGRKRCGRKKCTSNRDNRTLERIVKQNPFKNVGEIHKEWTAAGVSASRTTTHRRMQDMDFSCRIPCVKPLLNNRQRQKRLAWAKDKKDRTAAEWSKVMFSDESTFCISFGNQSPRVWRKREKAQNPCCLRSSVKFPQSVMVWQGSRVRPIWSHVHPNFSRVRLTKIPGRTGASSHSRKEKKVSATQKLWFKKRPPLGLYRGLNQSEIVKGGPPL